MAFVPPAEIREEIAASLAHAPRASGAAAAGSSDVVDSVPAVAAASERAPAPQEEKERLEQAAAPAAGTEAKNGTSAVVVDAEQRTFGEIIAPLVEASGGKPLAGPGLEWCRAAYQENAEAFALLAEHALKYGKPPLGRLCAMVRDGDHRLWAAAVEDGVRARLDGTNGGRPARPCPGCGVGAGQHAADCTEIHEEPAG
jgi:hypothetical protein